MRVGVRGKLLLASLALLGIALLAAEVVLVPSLERSQLLSSRQQLTRVARAVAENLSATDGSPAVVQELAVRLGRSLGVRVTFIGHDGVVLGESGDEPSEMTNHADRPEVLAAIAGRVGTATRQSATLGVRFLYAAVPAHEGASAITRVALRLDDVDASVRSLRRTFRIAALVGLVVATLMSTLAAYLASAPLLELKEVAQGLARRDFSRRAQPRSEDEIGALAGDLNTLSADLAGTIEELEYERERTTAVLNAMNEGILVTDPSGRVVGSNPALERLFGARAGPTIGATIPEVSRQPELIEHIERVARSGEPHTTEVEFTGPTSRIIDLSSAPIPGERGVVTTLRDVTQVRQLERVRQDFIANVSHELRTPVAAIQGATETLLGGALEQPQARMFVEIAGRHADRLVRLVSDLLDLARLDGGETRFESESVDLREAIRVAIESLESKAVERRVTASSSVPNEVARTVRADRGALDQILVNLLDNAIKYTPAGGAVGIDCREVGDRIEFAVWDHGSGIEERHRDRVFERFYRVDPGRARELGGTGLGLSIVRHLVDGLGGTVRIDGQQPTGTRVVFDLPRG